MTLRKGLVLAAFILLALQFLLPKLPLPQAIYRYLWVIDITQSMNTPDYNVPDLPKERLEFVKATLRRALPALPCGSEVGVGVFTSQTVQVLFEPLEVCAHASVIDTVIARIDWRMAWAANSRIDQGLAAALRLVRTRNQNGRLVFLSDGQNAPGDERSPDFSAVRGQVRGFLIGTGSTQPSLVPRYDRDNRPLGYFLKTDSAHLPEADAGTPATDPYYHAWLDEAHLLQLADATGLAYQRLDDPAAFIATLNDPTLAEYRRTPLDVRWVVVLLATLLLLGSVMTAR